MSFAFTHQKEISEAQKDIENIIHIGKEKLEDYVNFEFDIRNPIAKSIESWLKDQYNVVRYKWGYRIYLRDSTLLKELITMPSLERMKIIHPIREDDPLEHLMHDYGWILLASVSLTVLYFWM
jgi:hypothetical protein